MGRAIKVIFGVALAGVVVLLVYGYAVPMAPLPAPQSVDVVLDGK